MARRGPDPGKEQFWRERLRRWRQSSLSIRAFCARDGLSEPSFYQWRRELTRRDRAAAKAMARVMRTAPPTFVPLEVVAETTAAIEIALASGVVVRVWPGFDRQTLGQVLALLTAGAVGASQDSAGGAAGQAACAGGASC